MSFLVAQWSSSLWDTSHLQVEACEWGPATVQVCRGEGGEVLPGHLYGHLKCLLQLCSR